MEKHMLMLKEKSFFFLFLGEQQKDQLLDVWIQDQMGQGKRLVSLVT